MRAFWEAAELLDRTVFKTLDKVDRLQGRKSLRERTADAIRDVREPQRVITFEK